MRFSYNPGNLDVYDGGTGKSFGSCAGYLPPSLNCANGFATDDIYFLEVCLVSFLCKNREELFTVGPEDFYVCEFDGDAFDELQALLMQPPMNRWLSRVSMASNRWAGLLATATAGCSSKASIAR